MNKSIENTKGICLVLVVIGLLLLGGLSLSPAEIAYCAGGASSSSIVGPQSFTQFMQLPDGDGRRTLLELWQEFGPFIDTCQEGRLPDAPTCYDMVSQLQPVQLQDLIDTIIFGLTTSEGISGPKIQECLIILDGIKEANNLLFLLFCEGVIPGLIVATGLCPPDTMPPQEAVDLLLRLRIKPDINSYYASQICALAQPLDDLYRALFELLPYTPEMAFMELLDDSPNTELSQDEVEVIQKVNKRFRESFFIALHMQRLLRRGNRKRKRFS